jgi:hypothetical protein
MVGEGLNMAGLLNFGSLAGTSPRGALRAGAGRDAPDTSYRISHQPVGPSSEDAIRLDDLTRSITGETAGYPEDFYSAQGPQYYAPPPSFAGDEYGLANQQSYRAIQAVRNNPDAEVTIYRAVPNDENITEINPGDWITLSPKYAELHAASGYGPRGEDAGKVISQTVRVRDIFWGGDDVNEFGFFPSHPQTPAQRVAGLLSSGRADEVTDEMMAAADPQEMARLYASGATGMDLPMDYESRMARAREMGFNPETRFHGTKASITDQMRLGEGGTMGQGVYTASDPIYSDFFAGVERVGDETRFREGGNVLPLLTRGETMPFEQFAQMRFDARRANASGEFGENFDIGDYLDDEMRRQGFTGVRSDEYGPVRGRDEVATRYPSDIRSRFARFDPRLSHLSNLNAANASPLLGGAVLAAPQEQPDPLRNLRGLLAR